MAYPEDGKEEPYMKAIRDELHRKHIAYDGKVIETNINTVVNYLKKCLEQVSLMKVSPLSNSDALMYEIPYLPDDIGTNLNGLKPSKYYLDIIAKRLSFDDVSISLIRKVRDGPCDGLWIVITVNQKSADEKLNNG